MTPKISIIIPVYNSGKTLRRCVDSVISQTLIDFECIMIDDGSTDESGGICDDYVGRDSRFRVFHKDNGGVSSARNVGLDNMKGEYVVFIDSDDWVLPNYLKNLYDGLLDCDITISYSTYCYSDGSIEKEKYPAQIISQSCFSLLFTDNDLHWHTSPWGKLFRSDIIQRNSLRFKKDVHIGEDAIFLYNYLRIVDTVSVISCTDYCYLVDSSGSLTKKINSVKSEQIGMELIIKAIDDLIEDKRLSGEAVRNLNWLKSSYIRRVLTSLYYNSTSREKRLEIIRHLDTDMYCRYIDEKSFLEGIYSRLLGNQCYKIYDSLRICIMRLKLLVRRFRRKLC